MNSREFIGSVAALLVACAPAVFAGEQSPLVGDGVTDDTVALNSNDDHGGPATSEGEPITDIVIDGIRAEGSHSAVRLLSTGGEIRNITIRNIHGTFYRYAVGLTHFFRWDPSKPRGRSEDFG